MKDRIHILGPSGAGTTTIAKAICEKTGCRHFDSDDYFWLPTDEPYTIQRSPEERLRLLERDLQSSDRWVLSGSLTGWGDALIPLFELVVFVYVSQNLRLERLRKRESERYGEAMEPGGARYEAELEFLDWAAGYEDGTRGGRTLAKHESWLRELPCPVLRIVNLDLEESVQRVLEAMKSDTFAI